MQGQDFGTLGDILKLINTLMVQNVQLAQKLDKTETELTALRARKEPNEDSSSNRP